MMTQQEIELKLNAIIRYLAELDVTVSLSADETVAIAQLRDKQIAINTQSRDSLSCIFTVAHLFGHLVQFVSSEKYADVTKRVAGPKPMILDENFRRAFYAYEVEAFRFGKALILSCFEVSREIDSKYILFLETDFAHFWNFITTGQKGDIATFNQMLIAAYGRWETNQGFLEPLPHQSSIRLRGFASSDVV